MIAFDIYIYEILMGQDCQNVFANSINAFSEKIV